LGRGISMVVGSALSISKLRENLGLEYERKVEREEREARVGATRLSTRKGARS